MDFNQFLGWGFTALMSGTVIYIASIIKEMKNSLIDLNIKLAVVLEKDIHHEKRLDKHDEQIEQLLSLKR